MPQRSYTIILTDDAAQDLRSVYEYILQRDGSLRAAQWLDHIETCFNTLRTHPQRGTYPKELCRIGIRDYREVFFKPYRIIYRVHKDEVYVYLVVDGRRDLQSLFQQRLSYRDKK